LSIYLCAVELNSANFKSLDRLKANYKLIIKTKVMINRKNHVQLIGRLGATPDVKILESGSKLTRFAIAVNEYYKNKQGKIVYNTQWHNIVAWGSLANVAERILLKGSEVTIDGKLLNRTFTDKEGKTRTVTEIVVNELFVLYPKAA
jgi:single-strand DNA-binding protein